MSPNRSYLKGARAEYIVRDDLRASGWLVMRSYASKGAFDLMAIAAGCTPLLVACNSGTGRMTPAQRDALIQVARQYGADALHAHYDAGAITYTPLAPHE